MAARSPRRWAIAAMRTRAASRSTTSCATASLPKRRSRKGISWTSTWPRCSTAGMAIRAACTSRANPRWRRAGSWMSPTSVW